MAHCDCGVFRDGVRLSTVMCALLCAIEQLKVDQETDVFTIVQMIRQWRPQAVETEVRTALLQYCTLIIEHLFKVKFR
jgi:hypothetical protein